MLLRNKFFVQVIWTRFMAALGFNTPWASQSLKSTVQNTHSLILVMQGAWLHRRGEVYGAHHASAGASGSSSSASAAASQISPPLQAAHARATDMGLRAHTDWELLLDGFFGFFLPTILRFMEDMRRGTPGIVRRSYARMSLVLAAIGCSLYAGDLAAQVSDLASLERWRRRGEGLGQGHGGAHLRVVRGRV